MVNTGGFLLTPCYFTRKNQHEICERGGGSYNYHVPVTSCDQNITRCLDQEVGAPKHPPKTFIQSKRNRLLPRNSWCFVQKIRLDSARLPVEVLVVYPNSLPFFFGHPRWLARFCPSTESLNHTPTVSPYVHQQISAKTRAIVQQPRQLSPWSPTKGVVYSPSKTNCSKNTSVDETWLTHTIHVWYIYLHLGWFFMAHVGQYTIHRWHGKHDWL